MTFTFLYIDFPTDASDRETLVCQYHTIMQSTSGDYRLKQSCRSQSMSVIAFQGRQRHICHLCPYYRHRLHLVIEHRCSTMHPDTRNIITPYLQQGTVRPFAFRMWIGHVPCIIMRRATQRTETEIAVALCHLLVSHHHHGSGSLTKVKPEAFYVKRPARLRRQCLKRLEARYDKVCQHIHSCYDGAIIYSRGKQSVCQYLRRQARDTSVTHHYWLLLDAQTPCYACGSNTHRLINDTLRRT